MNLKYEPSLEPLHISAKKSFLAFDHFDTTGKHPETLNPQPSTLNPQPSIFNPKPETRNLKP